MARAEIRFEPPRLDLSPELNWILLRAFASPELVVKTPTDVSSVFDITHQLDLAGRIGARIDAVQLRRELGPGHDQEFAAATRSVVFNNMRVLRAASRVATIAAEASTPLVLLKGCALLAGGFLDIRERATGDVDVLVPKDQASRLAQRLQQNGYRFTGASDPDHHHLAPMAGPDGILVEIHNRLGKAVGAVDFDSLASNGGLVDISMDGVQTRILSVHYLAAHVLLHVFVEHGLAPGAYPSMRWIGDLAALTKNGLTNSEKVRAITDEFLSITETTGAFKLVENLQKGQVEFARESAESILLAHFIGQVLDQDYKKALRLRRAFAILTGQSRGRIFGELFRLAEILAKDSGSETDSGAKDKATKRFSTRRHPLNLVFQAFEILTADIRTRIRPRA